MAAAVTSNNPRTFLVPTHKSITPNPKLKRHANPPTVMAIIGSQTCPAEYGPEANRGTSVMEWAMTPSVVIEQQAMVEHMHDAVRR